MSYTGSFDNTIFYNPQNRYTVINIKTDDTSVPEKVRNSYKYADHLIRFCAFGYELPRSDDVTLELDGEWVKDLKYGYQLKVTNCREIIPQTLEGVRNYLSSGRIECIDEKTARAIVNVFGVNAINVLEETPERLLEVRGITNEIMQEIKVHYFEQRVLRELMTFLAPFEIKVETALKIYECFGKDSLATIRSNPFELCRFRGFSFKKVDTIYKNSGGRPNGTIRIAGGILNMLHRKCKEKGHLFLDKTELCKSSMRMLNYGVKPVVLRVTSEQIEIQLQEMIMRGEVICYKDSIYSRKSFTLEDETANCIAQIIHQNNAKIDVTHLLARVVQKFDIKLSVKQKSAVEMAFLNNLSIITGSPGTGKTTVLRAVLEVFKELNPEGEILLTAPTGRASRRMAESTGFDEAGTLHSILGLLGGDEEEESIIDGELLEADLVIVDETSMADMWLAAQLFSRLKSTARLILVGDADQLPSVGPGDVFRELILSGEVQVTVLDEIFRQTKDSLIAHNAKFINENKTSLYYGNDFMFIECETEQETAELIQQIYIEEVFQSDTDKVQILSPYRTDGEASAEKLNLAIREEINPCVPEVPEMRIGTRSFRIGDKVMQTKNKGGISNGDIGYIRSFNHHEDGEATVTIVFSGERTVEYERSKMSSIKFAYAMTVHKAMGSEYETVIMPILAKHMILLYRNLVYTGITRAKRRIFLVGEKDILFMAIHRSKENERNTMLGTRICRYLKSLSLRERLKEDLSEQKLKLIS